MFSPFHAPSSAALLLVLACCAACSPDGAAPESNPPCDTVAGVVPLVDNGLYAYAIAVDDAFVYVASTNGVWRVAKTGGAPSLVSAADTAGAIAVAAQRVYWIGLHQSGGGPKPGSSPALFAAPIGGGAATLLAETAYATQLAVDDLRVYGGGVGFWSVSVAGGVPAQLADPSKVNAEAIALGDDGVYVASFCCSPSHGSILRVPKAGGDPTVLVANQSHPNAIAVDTKFVYWINAGYGAGPGADVGGLMRAARDGSAVTTLVTDSLSEFRGMSALAVDGIDVYWTESVRGRVVKMPKAGGAQTVIADGLVAPAGLVARGGNVYWVSQPLADASAGPTDGGGAATVMTACK